MKARRYIIFIAFSLISLFYPSRTRAYGLLSHEIIIDASWEKSILPLLKQKYPQATDSDLKEAREYVYGGSVIPDIGYYPFGDMFFTDLIHYVRTGDFIQALLDESQNIDEYAFALGVLCHYTADTYGHSIGTNRAVPLRFPKKEAKYGDVITYEEDPISHIQMEFCFDVLQAATGNYSTKSYDNFIGFKISQPVLERAFYKTYSLDLKNYYSPASIAFLRYSIKHIFEELTAEAWKLKKSDIIKLHPLMSQSAFLYKIKRKNYYKEYGRPKFKSIFFYGIVKILPKIGPLRILKFEAPNPQVEKVFAQSLDTVIENYSLSIQKLYSKDTAIKNNDYDTGDKTFAGEYRIADESYYKLVFTLENNGLRTLNPALKQNLLEFYNNPVTLKYPKENSRKEKKLSKSLAWIKAT